MTLFDDIPAGDVDIFFEDLKMMLRLVAELDKQYGDAAEEIYQNEPKFEEIIELFHKKYPGIRLKKIKSTESFLIRICLLDVSLKDVFREHGLQFCQRVLSYCARGCQEVC